MIKITPAQITLKPDTDFEIKAETNSGKRIDKKDISLIMLSANKNQLSYTPCTLSSSSITVGNSIKGNTTKLLEDISKCQQQGTVPALRINQNINYTQTQRIGATEEAIIPLFITTKESLLLKERTESVLGQIALHLTISNFECTPKIIFTRQNIVCQSTITNTTDSYIKSTIVSTYSEKFPQFITKKETILQSNVLLIPAQSTSTSQIIRSDDITPGIQQNEITVTFQEPTNDFPYTTSQKVDTIFIPWQILAVTASILLIISAILIRNIYFFPSFIHWVRSVNKAKPSKARLQP